MIIGIGTDLVDCRRVENVLNRHGMRFVKRCYADQEQEKVLSRTKADSDQSIFDQVPFFAKRWAAKEACAKALGTGIADQVFLKDIVILNDEKGKPYIELRSGALKRLHDLLPEGRTAHIYLSLSDEPPLSSAFVVIEAV